eukprot:3723277-Prymnesium_polylepis.1
MDQAHGAARKSRPVVRAVGQRADPPAALATADAAALAGDADATQMHVPPHMYVPSRAPPLRCLR